MQLFSVVSSLTPCVQVLTSPTRPWKNSTHTTQETRYYSSVTNQTRVHRGSLPCTQTLVGEGRLVVSSDILVPSVPNQAHRGQHQEQRSSNVVVCESANSRAGAGLACRWGLCCPRLPQYKGARCVMLLKGNRQKKSWGVMGPILYSPAPDT